MALLENAARQLYRERFVRLRFPGHEKRHEIYQSNFSRLPFIRETRVEVKWTDRYVDRPNELKSLFDYCKANKLKDVAVTTRTKYRDIDAGMLKISFVPTSIYCFTAGYNLIKGRAGRMIGQDASMAEPRVSQE